MYESVEKADLLSDNFESKQSMVTADLPTYHPSSSLTIFAFRLKECICVSC